MSEAEADALEKEEIEKEEEENKKQRNILLDLQCEYDKVRVQALYALLFC